MYWSPAQQLAHHSINGCAMSSGDLLGTGTISGPERGSFGSMLEITWRGTQPLILPNGQERKFINDGDAVMLRGHCEKEGVRSCFLQLPRIVPRIHSFSAPAFA
jgi:fumarylacetoacetase